MKQILYFLVLQALVLVYAWLASCNQPTNSQKLPAQYRQTGDSVTTQVQQLLLKNLTGAVEQGGYGYAVEFCNIYADSLTKLAALPPITGIQRLSANNRNPKNALSVPQDIAMFAHYTNQKANQKALTDTVVTTENGYVYYKPIMLVMPTCLKCHGKPDADIDAAALEIITQKYPADRAQGYQLNDLRGMWKLTFANEFTNP